MSRHRKVLCDLFVIVVASCKAPARRANNRFKWFTHAFEIVGWTVSGRLIGPQLSTHACNTVNLLPQIASPLINIVQWNLAMIPVLNFVLKNKSFKFNDPIFVKHLSTLFFQNLKKLPFISISNVDCPINNPRALIYHLPRPIKWLLNPWRSETVTHNKVTQTPTIDSPNNAPVYSLTGRTSHKSASLHNR